MANHLKNEIFQDETKAREWLEARLWPTGPVCPHCGVIDGATALQGTAHRPGLYQCNSCREQFTVTVGTVFERSKIALNKWLMAVYLLCASKKGMSSHQLHRMLGVSYKTAWFMTHRIREAMADGGFGTPFGDGGGFVEADETFIGKDPDKPKAKRGPSHMNAVLSLVDRDTGQARSLVVDFSLKWSQLLPLLDQRVSYKAHLLTDEAGHYKRAGLYFKHDTVNHAADEYVRLSDRRIHTNTVEGFFSIFKRGMKGVYQHCGRQHLHRYLAEFDFRYNNRVKLGIDDAQRMEVAVKGIKGKRLMYRTPAHQAQA